MSGKILRKIRKKKDALSAYVAFISKRSPQEKRKSVCIEMTRILPNRRLFHVCRLLGECGFDCFVNLPFRRFMELDTYGLAATHLQNVFAFGKTDESRVDLLITDSADRRFEGKKIVLDYAVFDSCRKFESGLFYPIHFHPDFMKKETESFVLKTSRTIMDRKIGVLFAGNADKDSYDDARTVQRFGIHTRWDLFNDLENRLPDAIKCIPESYAEFISLRDSGALRDKVVLIDINRFKIPQNQWFNILIDSVFFIHLPGYIQPWCHNQIESMASGAIPILEYPEIFHPSLMHGASALCFSGKDELIAMLTGIVRGDMSAGSIAEMKKNVLAYYDANLSFDSFARRLTAFVQSESAETRLYICAGDESM